MLQKRGMVCYISLYIYERGTICHMLVYKYMREVSFVLFHCINNGGIIPILNTLRPGQNGRHSADDIFKCDFLKENFCILIHISLEFYTKGQIDNTSMLVKVLDWCQTSNKQLLESMLAKMHPVVTWYQWVHCIWNRDIICCMCHRQDKINSSAPRTAYMRQWTGSTLVQVMACRLFGAKPLPEPMLTFCQLDPLEQTSVKFESKYEIFRCWNCIWKRSSVKWQPFCLGENDLNIVFSICMSQERGISHHFVYRVPKGQE